MTARRFAFVLLSLAPACALAQPDAEDLPPPPAPRLEAYQALKGIDPAAWKALELIAQGIQAKHARLPKVMEIQSITHMTVRGGLLRPSQTLGTVTTNTNRLSPLPGGFVLVESDYTVESENLEGSGKSTELRWLGFIVLYRHDVFNAKTQRAILGTHESRETAIAKLDKWGSSDLKLEEMKPGYRWKFEYASAREGKSGSSRSADFKLSCEAAEGGSAATLAPELSGNFLKVTCENAARARPVPGEWAFLEDYGYFLALGASTERVSIQSRIRVPEATPRP
jgi:hypothetical protein